MAQITYRGGAKPSSDPLFGDHVAQILDAEVWKSLQIDLTAHIFACVSERLKVSFAWQGEVFAHGWSLPPQYEGSMRIGQHCEEWKADKEFYQFGKEHLDSVEKIERLLQWYLDVNITAREKWLYKARQTRERLVHKALDVA